MVNAHFHGTFLSNRVELSVEQVLDNGGSQQPEHFVQAESLRIEARTM
jgi:hypothetical protein